MEENLGSITIAPNVLITIVHKTAASVPGVARLSHNVPGVKRFLGLHTVGQGVEVKVVDDQVSVDVYLVAKRDVDLLQMGRLLQREITRSIQAGGTAPSFSYQAIVLLREDADSTSTSPSPSTSSA